jgi:hypothetical protein
MGTHQQKELMYHSFEEPKAVIILVVFCYCLAGIDMLVTRDCVCRVSSAIS